MVCRYKSTISPGVFFIFLNFWFLRAFYPQKPLKNSKNLNGSKTALTILIKLSWFIGTSVPNKMICPGSLRKFPFKSYTIFSVSKFSFLGFSHIIYKKVWCSIFAIKFSLKKRTIWYITLWSTPIGYWDITSAKHSTLSQC